MLSLPKSHLYVPDFIAEPVNGLLDAYRAFQRCEMPCDVTPMQASSNIIFGALSCSCIHLFCISDQQFAVFIFALHTARVD